ncbi:MAG: hypothetical protein C4583_08550 [Anaerolineaceae bacterium]|nr:MAG: hypothetical protein C4583_08550 [Anaerolineaceae bacterium]
MVIIGLLMPYLTVGVGLYVVNNAWVAVLGYHAGIILLVTLAGAWPRLGEFRPNAPLWKTILFGLTGLSAGAALYFLWPFIHVSSELTTALLRWGLNPRSWPLFIAYGALVNPWLEEAFWRGWLGSANRHPVLHDAVFAGFHLVVLAPFFPLLWLIVAFLVLAFSGWLWRQVIRTEKSMLASTLFHMAADVSILLVIWSTVRR